MCCKTLQQWWLKSETLLDLAVCLSDFELGIDNCHTLPKGRGWFMECKLLFKKTH